MHVHVDTAMEYTRTGGRRICLPLTVAVAEAQTTYAYTVVLEFAVDASGRRKKPAITYGTRVLAGPGGR